MSRALETEVPSNDAAGDRRIGVVNPAHRCVESVCRGSTKCLRLNEADLSKGLTSRVPYQPYMYSLLHIYTSTELTSKTFS